MLCYVKTPLPGERSRVLRRFYKERIVIRVACRGDSRGVNRRPKTKESTRL